LEKVFELNHELVYRQAEGKFEGPVDAMFVRSGEKPVEHFVDRRFAR
jgi:hypothetical protein